MDSKQEYIEELKKIVGRENMTTSEPILEVYSMATPAEPSGIPNEWDLRPDVVVQAGSVDDIRNILSVANRYKVPVYPGASYISVYNDAVPLHGGILLLMDRMDNYWIDEQAEAITIEPGVTSGRLWKEVAPKGYMPPYTSLPAFTFLTGTLTQRGEPIFAKDAAVMKGTKQGPYGIEFVTGLEVVIPTGEIVRTGVLKLGDPMGQHESRYRIGGPDLTDLFLGSCGAFGVVTKLRMKLFPLPEGLLEEPYMDSQGNVAKPEEMGVVGFWSAAGAGNEIVMYGFEDLRSIISAMKQVDKELPHLPPPSAINWEKLMITSAPNPYPYEKPEDEPQYALILILEKDRKEDYTTVDTIIRENDGARLSDKYGKGYLTVGSVFSPHAGPIDGYEYRWRFGGGKTCHNSFIPPDRFVETMEKVLKKADEYGIKVAFHPSIKGARPIMMYPFDIEDPEETRQAQALEQEAIQIMLDAGGSFYRANYGVNKHQMPRTGMHYELLKQFKKILDPNNIMAPGQLAFPIA